MDENPRSLSVLREAVRDCRNCDLYLHATQAVPGEGHQSATMMLVGEQPGDEEDRQGLPFVGPAGRLLDRALQEAGIERASTYVTNAVKHFKFEERGKRRIHKKPNEAETRACLPWLEAEIALVKPRVLICLGATAAKTLFGPAYRVTKQRGQFTKFESVPFATSTVHPSSILRMPDEGERHLEYRRFVADLRVARAAGT